MTIANNGSANVWSEAGTWASRVYTAGFLAAGGKLKFDETADVVKVSLAAQKAKADAYAEYTLCVLQRDLNPNNWDFGF